MKNILVLLVVLLTFSCQKVVDITPKAGDQKVIIQGYLYKDSTIKVVVIKSSSYLSTTKPVSLSTAIITLTNSQGITEALTWNATNKWYESNAMKGIVNDFYKLQVSFEGKKYSATSILPDLAKADSITVKKRVATSLEKESYQMKLYAKVATDIDLYYLFKGFSNKNFLNGPNDINIANNKLLAGNLNGWNVGYDCEAGKEAELYMFSLTKEAYNFYEAASIQLNNDGGFFSTPPANVPSMFDNDAIGLFQCSTIQVLKTYVKPQ